MLPALLLSELLTGMALGAAWPRLSAPQAGVPVAVTTAVTSPQAPAATTGQPVAGTPAWPAASAPTAPASPTGISTGPARNPFAAPQG